jgi:hypothetical protein
MDFHLKKIFDYWDFNNNAIDQFSEQLRTLSPENQIAFCSSLRNAITDHVNILTDQDLLRAGAVIADDLYRSIWIARIIDDATLLYLKSSASVFLSLFRQRGYVLQYIVDNSFVENTEAFQGLLDYFNPWYTAAGFIFICPQVIALKLMQSDGITRDKYFVQLPRYIREARYLMQSIREKCLTEQRHFVLIDADFDLDFLKSILESEKLPGVLKVFRNEPPRDSSKISIVYPSQRLDYSN